MIEKNIVDRVPKYPGRVTLIPVDGVENAFDMTRADEPQVEGTPIDKATLETIIQSRLTGRYYMPTIARTVLNSRTGVTTNPLPQSGWQNVTLTRATNGEYIITASSSHSDSYTPNRATDGDQKSSWTSRGYAGNTGEWWQIQLPTPIAITSIRANLEDLSGEGQTFSFQGSANGTNWNELTRGTFNRLTGVTTYTFSNTTQYQYYRMYFTGQDEYSATIVEFEIASYNISMYNNAFEIASGVPLAWTTGQRITIQTPANVSTAGTQQNTLNGKSINTILLPSKKYELVYNGASFDAKGV